jgi:hypothetical protein
MSIQRDPIPGKLLSGIFVTTTTYARGTPLAITNCKTGIKGWFSRLLGNSVYLDTSVGRIYVPINEAHTTIQQLGGQEAVNRLSTERLGVVFASVLTSSKQEPTLPSYEGLDSSTQLRGKGHRHEPINVQDIPRTDPRKNALLPLTERFADDLVALYNLTVDEPVQSIEDLKHLNLFTGDYTDLLTGSQAFFQDVLTLHSKVKQKDSSGMADSLVETIRKILDIRKKEPQPL